MQLSLPPLLVLADPPDALRDLFGISLLERLLRIAQRIGFREAIIISDSVELVADHLARPSWARANVSLSFRQKAAGRVRIGELLDNIPPGAERTLLVSAGFYYDARLLKTMAEQKAATLLVDSTPPPDCAALLKNFRQDPQACSGAVALLDRKWLSRQDQSAELMNQLLSDAAANRIQTCDAAQQTTYVSDLRKHVRPVFFPAAPPELIALAERFPRDAAQNGTLDFPAIVGAPVEDWVVARLCRTSITPNQISLATALFGLFVTAFYFSGWLWPGTLLALVVQILDGVDGKLARTKIETTPVGKWEHVVDYFIELSWWTALAHYFHAYLPWAVLVGSDWLDQLARRSVKQRLGRNLDDVAPIDRFVRLIGGRRNIYIWIFAVGLALGAGRQAFTVFCCWGAVTAAVHFMRALQIRTAASTK